jgi:hypothetical protein
VDEAETGLKSALAVKIFGPDLATLEDKAVQVKNILKVPGIKESPWCGSWAAQPGDYAGPRQAGPLSA